MFIRKKDYEEMVRKHEEEINHYIWEAARYKVDAGTLRERILHSLCYFKYMKDDYYVSTGIERLKSAYLVTGGDMEKFYEILNSKD